MTRLVLRVDASAAGSITSGYGAETFLLRTADIGTGGQCDEGQDGDQREGLANGHGNLGRKGKPYGTCPFDWQHAPFLTRTVDFLSK